MGSDIGEKVLKLGNGLSLAYEDAGDEHSSTVVVFFHGLFGVGLASNLSPALASRGVHYITPTLPGWGSSSPVPKNTTYHDHLYKAITALLRHLHPAIDDVKLYLAGSSFGTVATQILYGASYAKFPYGSQIVAVMLLSPLSPPHAHKEFNQGLSWTGSAYFGSLSRNIPFKLVPRLMATFGKAVLSTPAGAKEMLDNVLLKKMGPADTESFQKWKAERGLKDGEELNEVAEGMHRSVYKSWEGLSTVSDVVHGGWDGYSPSHLDEKHSRWVFIVVAKRDKDAMFMGEWLSRNLKDSTLKYVEGGLVGTLFIPDDIWEDFMKGV